MVGFLHFRIPRIFRNNVQQSPYKIETKKKFGFEIRSLIVLYSFWSMNSRLRPVLEEVTTDRRKILSSEGLKGHEDDGLQNPDNRCSYMAGVVGPNSPSSLEFAVLKANRQYWEIKNCICRTRLTNWAMGSRLKPQSKGLALLENRLGFR